MASNFLGQIFRITTFGESHGPATGVVIDGCPALLPISVEEINQALSQRRPGKTPYTSSRQENDIAQILSGVFEGKTTGAPITILIPNRDADPSSYEPIRHLYRPGHANFSYLEKYGHFDFRGGGRASGRETAACVAAGAIAKKLLGHFNIDCIAYIEEIGGVSIAPPLASIRDLRKKLDESAIFCPDPIAEEKIIQKILSIQQEGDSLGGIIACMAIIPAGLGDPMYNKLEAKLAHAMLSIPGTKGFEMGEGFAAARMTGSEHNDAFELSMDGNVRPRSNHAGGTLGGISTGEALFFRTAFKPTPSIKKIQQTTTLEGKTTNLEWPKNARHDPCIAIRAVPAVEAMTALCLADSVLMNRTSKI